MLNACSVDYTTQEYFENVRESIFPAVQEHIATICLTYLSFNQHSLGASLEESVLLDYAANHWGDHARGVQECMKSMALRFLQDEKKVTFASQAMWNRGPLFGQQEMLTGVHVSALFGLDEILEHQLKEECGADTKDISGRTALSYASQEGHQAVMKVLLRRNDVDVNSKDGDDRTPLSIAAMNGQACAVKLLLACDDIDADWKDVNGRTPLAYAVDAQGRGELVVQPLHMRGCSIYPRRQGRKSNGDRNASFSDRHQRELQEQEWQDTAFLCCPVSV
jgi:Ankyrin repeats (3 copies)